MGLRIGLPMWANAGWAGSFFTGDATSGDYLSQYASVFNTVEGNTTFYAIPSEAQVASWLQQTEAHDFRFCFKIPKMITHDLKLQRCDLALSQFFERISPLRKKLGPIMIQLPPSFSGSDLPILEAFIKKLPAAFAYAVEVRHSDFYTGNYDGALDALLAKFRIDRVMFDTKALFSSNDASAHTLDAKNKKPNFPQVEKAIGKHPMLRFIGAPDLEQTPEYFARWLAFLSECLRQGKEPYVFVHLPDNLFAPLLAKRLYSQIKAVHPTLPELERWPSERLANNGQMGLF